MNIVVTFRHMETSEALKKYTEEKVSKLKKYMIPPIEANVVLSVEKFRHCAEVTLITNGATLNSQDQKPDMYAAIDGVVSKLERQVKKFKEKLKQHPGTEHDRYEYLSRRADAGALTHTEKVISENVKPQTMSVQEATLVLENQQKEFFLFINAASQTINVIYRRDDGEYGLIEPEQDDV